MKWQRALYQPCLPLGEHQTRITECERHIRLSREAACEGAVLLMNEGELLPFAKGQKVAIFGKAQIDYVKCGGGAGDVTVSYVRNIYDGCKMKEDKLELFHPLSHFYEENVWSQYQQGGQLGKLQEPDVPQELLERAASFTDTAVVCINRFSEETVDRRNDGTDDYVALSAQEKKMVEQVCDRFAHVVLLLNVGAMLEMGWTRKYPSLKAVLMLWQGGMEGGLAAADLLVGDANPSGKLVDTCAKTFEDYPSSEGFHESEDYVKYTEDVFVGYRYFETIPGADRKVAYPFGYGLSYTSFSISNISACDNGKKIFVAATVTNTGTRAGKEVVQLYYQPPTGRIPKPARELCAFIKTPLLRPRERYEVLLTFDIADMASYDDLGTIKKAAYVMERGRYRLHLGNSIRNTVCLSYAYELELDHVVKQCSSYCGPERLGKRLQADGSYLKVPEQTIMRRNFPCETVCEYHEPEQEPRLLEEVAEGCLSLDEFLAQLSDEELMGLLRGQENTGVANVGGMGNLPKFGIPNVMTVDGPAGVRLHEKGVCTTGFPIATALACTWNLSLVEEIGRAGALEAKENNLCIWLTPALNIHRSPLCGRNFEYYSEDPFVAGKMAAAMVRGIQSQNIVAVPKHLACNNKETNRMESDSVLSERALREIYLRGFEICVKESRPQMIMTSYNRINGVRASENGELLNGIVREEWGFAGAFTTDWWNTADHGKEVKAGNDIRMPIYDGVALQKAYENGTVTRDEMAVCAKRILKMILWLE